MTQEPEPAAHMLVAEGRDARMFDAGPGRIARRARNGRSLEREAALMRHLHEHGYPVPEVFDVRAAGTEIVMARIEGPDMARAMARRPWTIPGLTRLLADLHDRLHEIPAPVSLRLPRVDGGDCLLHMDLHPLNVMMSPSGPVVIDWSSAAIGDPLTDAAMTYVLLTCPDVPGGAFLRAAAGATRTLVARAFAQRYRTRGFDERLAWAARLKSLDRNLTPDEVSACERLARRAERRGRTTEPRRSP